MDAIRSKTCFLTLPAAVRKRERLRNDMARRRLDWILCPPRRGDGPALLVPAAFVVAAGSRSHLLADSADADVGIPANVCRTKRGIFRTSGRHIHRRSIAVG